MVASILEVLSSVKWRENLGTHVNISGSKGMDLTPGSRSYPAHPTAAGTCLSCQHLVAATGPGEGPEGTAQS